MSDDADIQIWSTEIRRGVIELSIMALLEKKKMYGYEIAKKLRALTNEILAIEEGTLYPLLRRLEKKGWVEVEWIIAEGRPRKYYKLTERGKIALEKMKFHWKLLVAEVNKVLEGDLE